MFSQVIAGVDGKANGRDAAVLASKLVTPEGQLTLVNVYTAERSYRDSVNFPEFVREDCLELLGREQAATSADAQVDAVGASSVGAGLHHVAEERGADLLVVGSCSRGAVGRVLLGDDMRASLEGAPCAVAVAPSGYAEHPGSLDTIGVAYDGSAESDAALGLAREVAREHSSKVAALNVINLTPTYASSAMVAIDWSDVINDLVREAQARLNSLTDIQGRAVRGIKTETLAQFCEQVDLLVVGSRGYGPARRMLFGSTSEYLAHHASCPLLVLRRGVEAHGEPLQATAGASGVPA